MFQLVGPIVDAAELCGFGFCVVIELVWECCYTGVIQIAALIPILSRPNVHMCISNRKRQRKASNEYHWLIKNDAVSQRTRIANPLFLRQERSTQNPLQEVYLSTPLQQVSVVYVNFSRN